MQPVVRYGDSVIGDTPLILRDSETKIIYVKTIQELGEDNNWVLMEDRDDKECIELNNYESWTDRGWTKISRVIRHKLAKDKKLLEISTANGFVVVTDEHSLLDDEKKIVKPSELKIGDYLLQVIPPTGYVKNDIEHFGNLNLDKYKKYKTQKEACEGFLIAVNNDHLPIVIYENDFWYLKLENLYCSKIIKMKEWNKQEEYVYDLTTENHHFQAGVGCLIVHNTDSNFSCYRIRENLEQVDEEESLLLWKQIIDFSKELVLPFIPEENQQEFSKLHKKYYNSEKINSLELPVSLEVLPYPTHYKTILPITDRLKQFLKEYMEESYLPWLWSIQEVVLRNLNNIDYKFPQWAIHQMNKIRLTAMDLTDEHIKGYESRIKQIDTQLRKNNEKYKKIVMDEIVKKENESLLNEKEIQKKEYENVFTKRQNVENLVRDFINQVLKDYWIQPYWDLSPEGKKIFKIEFYKGGKSITDKRSLDLSMDIGKFSGELIRSRLPFPHNFAYEKTFWPFLILCKKKYVGNKYEDNPNKYKQDFMGIVLKRRDNSPIVKEVCGGIIDILINKRDPQGAKEFLRKCLDDMFAGKYDIKYFLQSRTLKLKESYKDWTRIAHVFLAEKIAIRDPGNKPQSGDRIEFSVIKVPNDDPKKKLLQGELIETPAYIKQNNLEIDYLFYMTNQIQNPASQFLELVDNKIGELFDEYKTKYGKPKIVREKKVKEPKKPRVSKKKIIKKEDSLKYSIESIKEIIATKLNVVIIESQ